MYHLKREFDEKILLLNSDIFYAFGYFLFYFIFQKLLDVTYTILYVFYFKSPLFSITV